MFCKGLLLTVGIVLLTCRVTVCLPRGVVPLCMVPCVGLLLLLVRRLKPWGCRLLVMDRLPVLLGLRRVEGLVCWDR